MLRCVQAWLLPCSKDTCDISVLSDNDCCCWYGGWLSPRLPWATFVKADKREVMCLRWDFTAFSNICLQRNKYMLILISRGTNLRRRGCKNYLRFLISFRITETCWLSLSTWSPQLSHSGGIFTNSVFFCLKLFNNVQLCVRQLTLGYTQTRVIAQCGSRTRPNLSLANQWLSRDNWKVLYFYYLSGHFHWLKSYELKKKKSFTAMNEWQLNKI